MHIRASFDINWYIRNGANVHFCANSKWITSFEMARMCKFEVNYSFRNGANVHFCATSKWFYCIENTVIVYCRRRWTRTLKFLTRLSCPCPAGHRTTFFLKIQTRSGHRTETGQVGVGKTPDRQTTDRFFWENPDTGQPPDMPILEKPGHGQTPDTLILKKTDTDRHRTLLSTDVWYIDFKFELNFLSYFLFYFLFGFFFVLISSSVHWCRSNR